MLDLHAGEEHLSHICKNGDEEGSKSQEVLTNFSFKGDIEYRDEIRMMVGACMADQFLKLHSPAYLTVMLARGPM